MSYGGQSTGPWQRNVMQGHQQTGGFNQGSQMFMQNNMAAYGQGGGMQGVGSGNIFPGGGGGNSVSYPQPRSGLNPVAFQQSGSGHAQYNSVGTVTKMSNDCGLVNDEVFFYRNVCKGREPILGDRVIFEATYSNNGQFKWNATHIQLIQQSQPIMSSNKTSYSSVVPPSSEYKRAHMRRNSPKRSPIRGRNDRDRPRLHRSRERDEGEHERKRRREDNDRGVESKSRSDNEVRGGHVARNEKERDRGESRKKEREGAGREREVASELERAGPKDRRARNRKRYMVKIPKSLLTIKTADIQDLRQRYNALYIPSDFFLANIKWSETFTPDNPFSLRRPCAFHIMNEMVESPTEQNLDLLEPADANYLYSAKVMLMSLPPIAEIYKKSFESDDNDNHHAVHPSRLINFLVGVKGGVGSMAIGGPWSPSLDGENPDEDPSVLIRTAIRTCKALTGIDLSNCTQWYRFVELYYHRTEYKGMEKDGPPRVETVVIYLPDVHSCLPSIEEWQTLTQVYKNAADGVIARRSALVAAAAENANDDNDNADDVEMADNSIVTDDGAGDDSKETSIDNNENNAEDAEAQNEEEQEENMEDPAVSVDLTGADGDEEDGGGNVEKQPEEEATADEENDEPNPEPTHYSLLDLKTMKVQDIRDELLARNLPDKGVRNVVMARLAKALNTEKAEETKNKNKSKNPLTKKNEEKMDVDSKTSSKTADKKGVAEIQKKNEKKGTAEDNANGKEKLSKSPKGKKTSVKDKSEIDDKEDWADIIDFELSDIVVLDEYDSSKITEETNLKEMTEKEKARLIRYHTLPSSPHIVVHPNRQAKEGKFDCAINSLSVLLDYHPDDNKERFFEVSLFAELFNDMLMRDFGFNIYKEMYFYEKTAKTNNVSENTEITAEGDDTKIEKTEKGEEIEKDSKQTDDGKEKSTKKDSKPASDDKTGKEQHSDDLQSNKSRKRKISTSNSTANGKDHESTDNDKKMVVVKPQLLLSFVYFDTTHCGYIFEQDLEDLFTVLGLNLSRSQIKKLLGMCKLSKYQAIYYSKLTDKEESLVSTPAIEDVDDLQMEELEQIAAGNNQYESIFAKNDVHKQVSAIGNDESEEGLVNFNGTIVHVGKLLNQINRTEKKYSDLEKLFNDLVKQHNDLQKDHNKSTTKIKDIQAEIKSVSRKLIDANQDYYSLNRKYREQNSTLSYIYTRVAPYFAREKDKDKDAKSEGSRDKDKDNKDKDIDKSKDKESEKETETTKEDKEKEIKKEDNNNKEKSKDDNKNKENVKDDNEKEKDKGKIKDDKVKDEKDKEKENAKDKKEKELPKNDKETQKVKDEKDKEPQKVKDEKDKEPQKVKDEKDKETQKVKDEKDKEPQKVKVNKEKEQTKSDKEKPRDDKQNEKAKENKEKQTPKAKPTTQKNVTEKPKPSTPAVKKPTDSKPAGKILKKSSNVGIKK